MSDEERRDRPVRLEFPPQVETPASMADQDIGWRVVGKSGVWRPPTDVLETEDAFLVVVEVAGMRGSDFSVSFERTKLSVSGSRIDRNLGKAYHQIEIAYGDFVTEVNFNAAVNSAAIEATYNEGFLRVVLPKARPQEIKIEDRGLSQQGREGM